MFCWRAYKASKHNLIYRDNKKNYPLTEPFSPWERIKGCNMFRRGPMNDKELLPWLEKATLGD
ncbi:hypothetical protein GCM10010911_07710 [Paenibacillus nasutitermitis]|uniref:Uncharacterized protein n=1 Tax=Paenibacillus nasutitermitis TaxID=1652958 RepID=A0A916YMV8_9BACL|nr:hypothetical protein GCM10010911_07710 [Paenibacillus nasutitermitis]